MINNAEQFASADGAGMTAFRGLKSLPPAPLLKLALACVPPLREGEFSAYLLDRNGRPDFVDGTNIDQETTMSAKRENGVRSYFTSFESLNANCCSENFRLARAHFPRAVPRRFQRLPLEWFKAFFPATNPIRRQAPSASRPPHAANAPGDYRLLVNVQTRTASVDDVPGWSPGNASPEDSER